MANITEEMVWNKLKEVIDFEIGLDVVSLGLVYEVKVDDKNNIFVLMTMTTPMCPLAGMILQDAEAKLRELDGVNDVKVELTFDPPWTPERVDPNVRSQLGI
ncbi:MULTISPECIES: metal-sulfur cluster assembly factor [Thermosipho]|uniref:Aromatic ring hydroxylase n=1 Tax=Thermosipho affectus TaxID=660294 RepID=A0ABX3IHW7_9BACT|nr:MULTISPECIES: metal-sulfur cluster assembly factor [Thermosipho]ANQ54335.1 aromatic ring hydroxylating enzyme [Thermosipho sp. 1070]APT72780.1 aromatic ring hydroxylase [Thermosipho sp. 1063]MBT1247418.1 aromatic ring hydroxylase [Thermosipho sp. 1244]ONN26771.1 aromatic ring hydroxylase [Thermosipho affectus]OOC42216.1 aromatic ring hydroxylase [Thermosipho sp. 1074]